MGNIGTDGDIVTDYKEIMRGKSEIPISSCPPCVADVLYGSGADPERGADDSFFRPMVERLDERAAKVARPKKQKAKPAKKTVSDKIKTVVGTDKYTVDHCGVNTDNVFVWDEITYRIDNSAEQYRPKRTAVGMLYDMDKILCVRTYDGIYFFDMAADPLDKEKIKKISEA